MSLIKWKELGSIKKKRHWILHTLRLSPPALGPAHTQAVPPPALILQTRRHF